MQLKSVTQASNKPSNEVEVYEDSMMEVDNQNQIWEDAMETEEKSFYQAAYDDLLQQTLEYGQSLQAEFDSDPRREVKQALDEVFSLWAYEDPMTNKAVSHLLDRRGRVEVAEELNAAILSKPAPSSTLSSLFSVPLSLVYHKSCQLTCPSLHW